ncbi:MAG: hypothetical protein Q8P86_01230 [bacterium]|nr:hypothetical protein [bacterium]
MAKNLKQAVAEFWINQPKWIFGNRPMNTFSIFYPKDSRMWKSSCHKCYNNGMEVIGEAYEKSKELLKTLATESGFVASMQDTTNYKRVWARDSIIAGLSGVFCGDSALITAFENSLRTLRKFQDETGRIPSNVSVEEGKVSYGTTVGRIDATLWYVIGVCQMALITGNKAFFIEFKDSIEKSIFYLKCLELNGRGFLYIPQGGDWADEYINHGYVLYDQILYYFALTFYSKCTEDPATTQKKDYVRELIKVNFLPKAEYSGGSHVYHKALYEIGLKEYKPPLPVAYFSNHSIRFHVDTFACGLLLLSDIAPDEENVAIREKLVELAKHNVFPIMPSFHPVISQGDHNWDHLKRSAIFEFRNDPHEYQNGGLWPLVHGFFVSSFPKKEGEKKLEAFARTLQEDGYIFPEYYSGKTFEPKGIMRHGFSAAAYIIAYEGVVNGKRLF